MSSLADCSFQVFGDQLQLRAEFLHILLQLTHRTLDTNYSLFQAVHSLRANCRTGWLRIDGRRSLCCCGRFR